MPCSICESPLQSVVVSMADCAATVVEISTATGFSEDEVQRHLDDCLKSVAPGAISIDDGLAASDDRLHAIEEKISIMATSAGLAGDSKTALAGLNLALRLELESRRRIEESRKNAEEHRESASEYLDRLLAKNQWLAESEPAEVLKLFVDSMDADGCAMQAELKGELERYAHVWIKLRSDQLPIPETMRLVRFHIADMERRHSRLIGVAQ